VTFGCPITFLSRGNIKSIQYPQMNHSAAMEHGLLASFRYSWQNYATVGKSIDIVVILGYNSITSKLTCRGKEQYAAG
jgi:hypothetical protein